MPSMFGKGPPPPSGGGAPGDELEDDFADEDLGVEVPDEEGMGDEPSETFKVYAEQALGSADPAKISALRECIRVILEEGPPGGGLEGGLPPLPAEEGLPPL